MWEDRFLTGPHNTGGKLSYTPVCSVLCHLTAQRSFHLFFTCIVFCCCHCVLLAHDVRFDHGGRIKIFLVRLLLFRKTTSIPGGLLMYFWKRKIRNHLPVSPYLLKCVTWVVTPDPMFPTPGMRLLLILCVWNRFHKVLRNILLKSRSSSSETTSTHPEDTPPHPPSHNSTLQFRSPFLATDRSAVFH